MAFGNRNSNQNIVDQDRQAILDRLAQRGMNQDNSGIDLTFGNPILQKIGSMARNGARFGEARPARSQEDGLDRLIKYNQLETGSPEFKMKEAQTRADMDVQKGLDLERAKKAAIQADYDAAVAAEGSSQTTNQSIPLNMETEMPSSMPKTGSIPKFLQVSQPGTREYDEKIGRFVDKPGKMSMEKNPDYLTPEDLQAKAEREQGLRDAAEQNLSSIREAKKGAKYFGPFGDLPSIAAPSSLPVVGKATTGKMELGGEYGDRKMWESNVNQLLSQKVVDLITKMKSASKTGATGFGSLTEKEGATLREASTALNKGLPPEKALYYLNEMEKINQKFLSGGQSQPSGGFDQDKEARYQAWKAAQNVAA